MTLVVYNNVKCKSKLNNNIVFLITFELTSVFEDEFGNYI